MLILICLVFNCFIYLSIYFLLRGGGGGWLVGLLFCDTRFLRNLPIHAAIELRFERTSITRFYLLIAFSGILHMLKTKFFLVNNKCAYNTREFPTFLPSKEHVERTVVSLLDESSFFFLQVINLSSCHISTTCAEIQIVPW